MNGQPMTEREVEAQLKAAAICEQWKRDNPPPIRRTGKDARIWRGQMAAYRRRWQESAAFTECTRVYLEALG